MRIGAIILMLAAVYCAAGCSSSLHVRREPHQPQIAKVAVVYFDDTNCYHALRDYTLFGAAGCDRPGILVSRYMGRALHGRKLYDVIEEHDMRRAINELVKQTPKPTDADWVDLAHSLNADAVVVGDVEQYRSVWLLIFSTSNVTFNARCLDVHTGDTLWSAHAGGWHVNAVEEDLLMQRCATVADALVTDQEVMARFGSE